MLEYVRSTHGSILLAWHWWELKTQIWMTFLLRYTIGLETPQQSV